MSSSTRVTWVLLAAGGSTRFGGFRSKLLEEIDGRSVIEITLESLATAAPSAEIILVSSPEFRDQIGFTGSWTEGGPLRQVSAARGVARAGNTDAVLIHDAARPFVSLPLTARLLDALERFDAVAPALPVTDTLKRVRDSAVTETVDRGGLFSVQTPQAIRGDAASSAFARIGDAGSREFTDDLAVIEYFGGRTGIVSGDRENIKITTPGDLESARVIAHRKLAGNRAIR